MQQIEHIVVLIMENRSFDQMLGYLKLYGIRNDIDGLQHHYFNRYRGKKYNPYRINAYEFKPDPGHGSKDVEEQLTSNNGGFVKNFSKYDSKTPEDIMGFYDGYDLPVYHNFSENYCICDKWFSSVRGQTQPNRAYAYSGTSEGYSDNIFPGEFFKAKTIFQMLEETGINWNFYSHDIASLRFNKNHFFSEPIDKIGKFFERCHNGNLSPVSWIDPDFGIGPTDGNDDHPPHNIQKGQKLVGRIYNALINGKNDLWKKTMFIITYDEHGGFYDHVKPRKAEDDRENFKKYGVRVPAFVVSPWVAKRSVSSIIYDHTSIIKTIYERFCSNEPASNLEKFGLRTKNANSLWSLITSNLREDCKSVDLSKIKDNKIVEPNSLIRSEFQESLYHLQEYCQNEGLPKSKI